MTLRLGRPRSLLETAKRVYKRLFPERQIFYRSRGDVRFLSLRPWSQMLIASAFLVMGGWVGYASYSLVFHDEILHAREQQIADLTQAYAQLSHELQRTHENFLSVSGSLEDRYRQLYELTKEHGALAPNPVAEQTEGKGNKVLEMFTKPFRRSSSANHSGELIKKLADMRHSQEKLAEGIIAQAQVGITRMEEIIRMTNLDPARVAEGAMPSRAMGGPLRPAKASDDPFEQRMVALQATLSHWRALRTAAENMPLASPILSRARFNSDYGMRRDPFNGQLAFHSGIDLADNLGTHIYATAAGVVTFAGSKGPYGRMVELDHGGGFRTRYAHLQEIHVEAGDAVKIGHHIGDMGSTGRSTGVHLHYEVLHRGAPVDPLPFIEAGYVLKQQKIAHADQR